jgi:drug/metabolite transporter (DMT)-like permease
MAATKQDLSRRQQAALGAGFAALAAIGFSAKAVMVKLAYVDRVDALTLLTLRMAFSAPIFLGVALWTSKPRGEVTLQGQDWLAVLALGFIGYYLASLLDFMGLEYVSAGLERLILFLYPSLVVLLSAALFRRRIGRLEVAALALSYAGIALVYLHDTHGGGNIPFGAALVFAATLSYSLYLIGAGHSISRLGATRFTAYAMTVACGATFLQFLVTHPLSALALPSRVYGLGFAMAMLSTVVPVFMLSAGIRLIGSGRTALIGSIGPVSTLILAHWVLGETLSPEQLAGSALVLIGVLAISAKR